MNLEELKKEFENDAPHVLLKLYEWAVKQPNKKFLYYGEENQYITYTEFNEITNRIGNSLHSMGVVKGDRISLLLFNPLLTVSAMFGIWKAGAIFSPINFNYKGRLLSHQLNDTAPKYLIAEQALFHLLNDVKDDVGVLKVITRIPKPGEHDYRDDQAHVELDHKYEQFSYDDLLKGNTTDLNTEINYWDTANIIYTSGTTGPAKGVVQSHRWMGQYTLNLRRLFHPDDVLYNDLPMYHVGGSTDPEKIIRVWEGDTYRYANGSIVKMRACDHRAIQDFSVAEYVPPEQQKVSMTIPPYYWHKGSSFNGPAWLIPAEKVLPGMDQKLNRCTGKNDWGE